MMALVYTAQNQIELLELPMPEPKPDEVLVRVAWCGVCGSEVESFKSGRRRKPPLIMGHEFSGTVAAIGDGVSDLMECERVVINPLIPCGKCKFCLSGHSNVCPNRKLLSMHRPGGYAEYVCVPRRCVYRLPREVELKLAALTEPLANVVHAYRLIHDLSIGCAVIIGCGAIGLLCLQILKHLSNAKVMVIEPVERRRQFALLLGADFAVSPSEVKLDKLMNELSGEVDVCFDAVGKSETRKLSCKLLSPRGIAVWIGLHDIDAHIDGADVVASEKVIRGSYAYTDEDFLAAINLLRNGHIKADGWIAEVPLSKGKEIFLGLVNGAVEEVKVMLKCCEESC